MSKPHKTYVPYNLNQGNCRWMAYARANTLLTFKRDRDQFSRNPIGWNRIFSLAGLFLDWGISTNCHLDYVTCIWSWTQDLFETKAYNFHMPNSVQKLNSLGQSNCLLNCIKWFSNYTHTEWLTQYLINNFHLQRKQFKQVDGPEWRTQRIANNVRNAQIYQQPIKLCWNKI